MYSTDTDTTFIDNYVEVLNEWYQVTGVMFCFDTGLYHG